jgi:hypothetical protein
MIRINLLAEAQAAEELRRRDPVKRAIWGAAFVGLLVVGWVVWMQLKVMASERLKKTTERQWAAMTNQNTFLTNQIARTGEVEKKLAALERLSNSRFFSSAPLNAIQHCMISNIVVTTLTMTFSYNNNEQIKDSKGKLIDIQSREDVSISVTGEDSAAEGEGNHVKFTRKIADYPWFKTNLRTNEAITGTTRAGKGPEGADSTHGARFSFTLWFPSKVR